MTTKIGYITKLILLAIGLLSISNVSAQKKGIPQVKAWKKTVSRTIFLSPKIDTIPGYCSDTTLAEMIFNELKAGNIGAYRADDLNFTQKLSFNQLNPEPACTLDTIYIVDPETNKEYSYAPGRAPDFSRCHGYRIIEEWSFNSGSGHTEIQIIGIAPTRDIFRDDSEFLGSQSLFLVRYNDVHSIISRYERYHPDCHISKLIWDDYFRRGNGHEDAGK
jgi:hypothetical protein